MFQINLDLRFIAVILYHYPILRPHTMATRPAAKAGSWYEKKPDVLEHQLRQFMAAVPGSIDGVQVPIPGARIVIAP